MLYNLNNKQGCICQIFTGGVRVSTGYDWPSDYSGHGGCQIGKWRIVVHKYTGLARKWNWGIVRGLESTPKEVMQNFLGVNYLVRGVKPPDPPSNTALTITCIYYGMRQKVALEFFCSFLRMARNFTAKLHTCAVIIYVHVGTRNI